MKIDFQLPNGGRRALMATVLVVFGKRVFEDILYGQPRFENRPGAAVVPLYRRARFKEILNMIVMISANA